MAKPEDLIRTEAGKKLFLEMNKHWGSSVWGAVYRGILDIEAEAIKACCNANVIHNIYPEGKKVNPDMMDPNVGGFKGKSTQTE